MKKNSVDFLQKMGKYRSTQPERRFKYHTPICVIVKKIEMALSPT